MLRIAPENDEYWDWVLVVTADMVFLSELYACMPPMYRYAVALLDVEEPLANYMGYIQAQVRSASRMVPISFDDVHMQCMRGDVVRTNKVMKLENVTSNPNPNPNPDPEEPKKRKVTDKKGKGNTTNSGDEERYEGTYDDDDDTDVDDDVQQGDPKTAKKAGMDAVQDRMAKAAARRTDTLSKRGKTSCIVYNEDQ
jgi:hypothetical protein